MHTLQIIAILHKCVPHPAKMPHSQMQAKKLHSYIDDKTLVPIWKQGFSYASHFLCHNQSWPLPMHLNKVQTKVF